MALTYTPDNSLGQALPDFTLPTVDGKTWSSQSIHSAPVKVIVFMCNHCPYIKAIENRLIQAAKELKAKGVPFIGICSNDSDEYPEDHPNELLKSWREKNYNFPYLVDETQAIAKAFDAVCTPDFFVFDNQNKLRYRGRLDDSWKDESKVTQHELMDAVDALLNNKEPSLEQRPSMGCSIKWKN
ncbi:MAG: thioredoxin family protein [Bdellovibrionales bacterium]|nr:thioredoxin family protein [Bdellovibrionales bacterium]